MGVKWKMNYYSHLKLSTPALFDVIWAASDCLHALTLVDMWVATPSLWGQIIHAELHVAEVNFTLMPALMSTNTNTNPYQCMCVYGGKHTPNPHTRQLEAKQVGLMPKSHLSQRPHKESERDIAFI